MLQTESVVVARACFKFLQQAHHAGKLWPQQRVVIASLCMHQHALSSSAFAVLKCVDVTNVAFWMDEQTSQNHNDIQYVTHVRSWCFVFQVGN